MTTPNKSSSPNPRALPRHLCHLLPTDLKAAAQPATQATQGVVNMVQRVQRSAHRRLGLSTGAKPEKINGLTGQIYRSIRSVAALTGKGSDAVLGALLPPLDDPTTHAEASPQREAVLAWRPRWLVSLCRRLAGDLSKKFSSRTWKSPLRVWLRRL